MSGRDIWGQLVSLTDFETDPIEIKTEKFSIGRLSECDLSFPSNKLISGQHCYLERGKDGTVTLHDTSTNGTLLNMLYKITKGKSKELQHGDEFYLVYKKDNKELNVGFLYQDTEALKEEEGTQEYSPPAALLDATLEDSDCNYITPEKSTRKRKSDDEECNVDLTAKKPRIEESIDKTVSNESKDDVKEEKINLENQAQEIDKPKEKETEDKNCEPDREVSKSKKTSSKPCFSEKDDIEENLQCMICQDIMHDCISLQPCLHTFCSGCYSDWMSRSQECPSCRKKVQRINKNHIVNNLIEAYLKEHPAKRRLQEDIDELNKKNKITHDMLYPKDKLKDMDDSSDYSDTDDDDDDNNNDLSVPVFRPVPAVVAPAPALFGFGTPVFGVTRAFKTVCRQCPEYKDPAAENPGVLGGNRTALNTVNNLITGDGNQTKPDTATGSVATASGTDNQKDGQGPAVANEPSTLGAGEGEPSSSETGEAGPSTSGGGTDQKAYKEDPKEMPTAPNHLCPLNQNHVLCQCCLQPFPDFRHGFNRPADERPQQCGVCYRAFCHAYWGCRKADCLGCLNKFKEMNFGRKALAGLILDNQFESEIFKDYIDSKGMSVKDVLQECCRQMNAGRFTVPVQGTHRFTSETPVCYACGLNNFRQLAFQYRKSLKMTDLPAKAQNRPDCYWGSKCRTQKNKPHHARNFNHVCDQTRQF